MFYWNWIAFLLNPEFYYMSEVHQDAGCWCVCVVGGASGGWSGLFIVQHKTHFIAHQEHESWPECVRMVWFYLCIYTHTHTFSRIFKIPSLFNTDIWADPMEMDNLPPFWKKLFNVLTSCMNTWLNNMKMDIICQFACIYVMHEYWAQFSSEAL